MRSFDLENVGVNEKARKNARLAQALHGCPCNREVGFDIEAAFCGDFVRILSHERHGVRMYLQSDLQHLFAGGHFQVEIGCDTLAQQANVKILNMAAVAAQVHSNAVGSGELTNHGRSHDAWFWRAARLPHCSDVIDVYIESSSHR